jgi:hypothetical protein
MKPKPSPTVKTVIYLSDDNSVELFALTRGTCRETYLRRGGSVELVTEAAPNLNWKPEPRGEVIDLKRGAAGGDWTQHGGFNVRSVPKMR